MKSSLDYRLLPNLQVGLNAYLYRPDSADNLSLARQFGERVMGLGPGIKYDLGRWSFMLKSQLETGNRDQRADGMQSSVPGLVRLLDFLLAPQTSAFYLSSDSRPFSGAS